MFNKENEFNITIKDNFLDQKDFEIIKHIAQNINFYSNDIEYNNKKGHVFFTNDAQKKVIDILCKNVSKFFKIKILNVNLCQYSLVAKSNKVEVHNDASNNTNFQTILYIDGDEDVHCGTGFYIKTKKNYILNTHIGFKTNRIVSWNADVFHAPLSFTDNYKKRISLITQYKIET